MHYEGWADQKHPQSLDQGFRMAGWQVKPITGELISARRFSFRKPLGKPVTRHVEPKAMRVLLTLASRPGQFISKDELIEEAWDGRAVSDDVLTRAIHALRAAVDDDAHKPRYIETRSNVGYRLLVAVEPEVVGARFGLVRPILTVLAGLLLAVAVVSFLGEPNHRSPASPATIAVLPFLHLSDNESEDYLSDAMTELLILNLAQLPGIRVISRTSIMPFSQHRGSAASIARQLGADLLVEGSVQTVDKHLRVVAQLIDPFEDGPLWAQQFDRPMDDILALQQEISSAIALRIGTVVGEVAPLPDPLPSAEMEEYLQARYLLAREDTDSVASAAVKFEQLATQFPGFAPAHLGIAQSLLQLFKARAVDRAALNRAMMAANQFEALSGASSESHSCIGQITLFSDWDFHTAELRYQLALSLNPSDTVARRRYAWLLVALQEYDRAAEQTQQIRLLDPLYYENAGLATLMLYSGQVDAAVEEFERLGRTSAMSVPSLRTMGMAYLAAGRDQDAHIAFVKMLETAGGLEPEHIDRVSAMSPAQLYRHIIQVELFVSPIANAGFQSLLGNNEAALADLELAVAERDPFALFLGALPELANLHGDPRFLALLETIGVRPENPDHLRETRLISANLSNPQTNPHEN